MPSGYWLLDWIDECGLKSQRRVNRLVDDQRALTKLREHAEGVNYDFSPVGEHDETLVASRGIDLSGDLECSHFDCKKQQVDRLFSRVWHYFDRIVVVGMSAHEIKHVALS